VENRQGQWVRPTIEHLNALADLRQAADAAFDQAFQRWSFLPGVRTVAGIAAAAATHIAHNRRVEVDGGVKGLQRGGPPRAGDDPGSGGRSTPYRGTRYLRLLCASPVQRPTGGGTTGRAW